MKLALAFAICMAACNASAEVNITADPNAQCRPGSDKPYIFEVSGQDSSHVSVEIRSPDNDLVRTLTSTKKTKAKGLEFSWDGRDSRGQPVPNEAYTPVVVLEAADGTQRRFDPRENSGGEELKIPIVRKSREAIVIDVAAPARVSVRAGTRNGPMLNNLLDFSPRPAGMNRVAWSGLDTSGIVELAERDDFVVVSTGFRLPNHSILCRGSKELSYVDWRLRHYDTSVEPDLSDKAFERAGQRITRFSYLPRSLLASPRLSLEVVGKWQKNARGLPIVTGPVSFKVDVPKADLWALQQSQFEIAFFRDLEFVSEQEQGYTPLTWRWLPGGEAPGEKLITVNVSGYNGQVAAQTLAIDFQPTAGEETH